MDMDQLSRAATGFNPAPTTWRDAGIAAILAGPSPCASLIGWHPREIDALRALGSAGWVSKKGGPQNTVNRKPKGSKHQKLQDIQLLGVYRWACKTSRHGGWW
ncbi:hypothetical protein J6590_004951 [Homalodisca vitripennis]|nr:hypothetical protein J6590_004951 [Homalodisca vitripennis]